MHKNNASEVLTKAFLNAGKVMGLSCSELNHVADYDMSLGSKISPESVEGIRTLYFIRSYKKLYRLVGG
jgi:hypothetical protein